MTVAVTGAAGQLGRLVVEALLRDGTTPVVAIVRDPQKVADLAERASKFDGPRMTMRKRSTAPWPVSTECCWTPVMNSVRESPSTPT